LKSHKVDHIIVGSHVLAVYARPRFTEDIDIWVRRSSENALAIASALREFGFELTDEQAMKLASGRNMIVLGAAPNRIDILSFLGAPGREMDFDKALSQAVTANLLGVEVLVLSKQDFIESKQSAGRPKDLRDIEEVEEHERP
jgi:hypothetical protein